MFFSSSKCNDCTPTFLHRRGLDTTPPSTIAFSSIPFVLTWIATVWIAQQKLFPILSSDGERKSSRNQAGLPLFNNKDGAKSAGGGALNWRARIRRPSVQKLAVVVFSTSIGFSTVLVELLLCEVSNILNPAARALALRVTLGLLMALTIVVMPALEIHVFVQAVLGRPPESTSTRRTKPMVRLLFDLGLLSAWLLVFWYIPQASILRKRLEKNQKWRTDTNNHFSEECLERIGIIGISLMASLSGFAAVSSLWQTFGVRRRAVTESEISRKESGLNATQEMLAAKQSRMRALQHRMNDAPSPIDQGGFFGRVVGSFRGSNEATELKALRMEVSGLEMMRFTLSSSLSHVQSRFADQERSRTKAGKLLRLFNLLFAIYCAYRIGATSFSSLRRWWQPSHSFATSDPINNILALLTSHYDHDLDRAAWSRQFSFLLSGVMLMASFNAVLQTFRLFARFAPGLLQHAQTSLPLIISQIAGTYVIASAMLLGSNLPKEMSSVVTDALGAPLEGRFVEGWFESWFLVAVGVTATGILIGRKFGGGSAFDDDVEDESEQLGKQS